MKRIGIALLLGGALWIISADAAQAELRGQGHRPHRSLLPERQTAAFKGHVAGDVSFETLRMLSTGMTKAEVLSRAGHPRHEIKSRGTQRWVYSSSDDWIAEITFGGNHVTAINWTRSRP
jgi:hypothetical protein